MLCLIKIKYVPRKIKKFCIRRRINRRIMKDAVKKNTIAEKNNIVVKRNKSLENNFVEYGFTYIPNNILEPASKIS